MSALMVQARRRTVVPSLLSHPPRAGRKRLANLITIGKLEPKWFWVVLPTSPDGGFRLTAAYAYVSAPCHHRPGDRMGYKRSHTPHPSTPPSSRYLTLDGRDLTPQVLPMSPRGTGFYGQLPKRSEPPTYHDLVYGLAHTTSVIEHEAYRLRRSHGPWRFPAQI